MKGINMSLSENSKLAKAKWDRENLTVVGCRITKTKAEQFRAACHKLGLVPNQVLKQAVENTIQKASGDRL